MKQKKTRTKNQITKAQEIFLSEKDRIDYIYKKTEKGTITEVTNVSYDIKIEKKWITIIRYDSSHGFLHKHTLVSLNNPTDTPTELSVSHKGTHADWLTWAITDIKTNFYTYRDEFLQRSGLENKDYE